MRFFSTPTRTTARRFLLITFLLAVASLCVSRWGISLRYESALAQSEVVVVNAASYSTDALTPDTISAAYGNFITQNNATPFFAQSQPLPTTLGGVHATINNVPVGLFYVSKDQINLLIPSNIQDGNATIVVTNFDNTTRTGTVKIVRSAVGVFSARSTGQGVAAAQTTTDGTTLVNVFNPDFTERPIDAGTKDKPTALVLYVTGIRYTPSQNPTSGNVADAVTVKIQGVTAKVLYAGLAKDFAGLDQVNVIIPPELSGINTDTGCNNVQVVVTANGRSSNPVTIKIGGELPLVHLTPISLGETKTGTLAIDDQVQLGDDCSTFFFDAYDFVTTVPNTVIAVDLRSTQMDAELLLYQVMPDDTLSPAPIGFDDNFASFYSNAPTNTNKDALLIFVVQTPGRYVIYATSSDLKPDSVGDYTLKLTTVDAPQLSYNQTISNGSITTTDLQTSSGAYLDVYWFNGIVGDNVRVTMTSSAFFPALFLQSNDRDFITLDDNATLTNTAQIPTPTSQIPNPVLFLPQSSVYVITATPFDRDRTGAYTLSLARLNSLTADHSKLKLNLPQAPRSVVRVQEGGVKSSEASLINSASRSTRIRGIED